VLRRLEMPISVYQLQSIPMHRTGPDRNRPRKRPASPHDARCQTLRDRYRRFVFFGAISHHCTGSGADAATAGSILPRPIGALGPGFRVLRFSRCFWLMHGTIGSLAGSHIQRPPPPLSVCLLPGISRLVAFRLDPAEPLLERLPHRLRCRQPLTRRAQFGPRGDGGPGAAAPPSAGLSASDWHDPAWSAGRGSWPAPRRAPAPPSRAPPFGGDGGRETANRLTSIDPYETALFCS
jgi:hypothetical protein